MKALLWERLSGWTQGEDLVLPCFSHCDPGPLVRLSGPSGLSIPRLLRRQLATPRCRAALEGAGGLPPLPSVHFLCVDTDSKLVPTLGSRPKSHDPPPLADTGSQWTGSQPTTLLQCPLPLPWSTRLCACLRASWERNLVCHWWQAAPSCPRFP